MKVLVSGTRALTVEQKGYVYTRLLSEYVAATEAGYTWIVIAGGATGVDSCADQFALDVSLRFYRFPAQWGTYGKKAGVIRNIEMLDKAKPDLLIAFPSVKSIGTRHCIREAQKRGVQTIVHEL